MHGRFPMKHLTSTLTAHKKLVRIVYKDHDPSSCVILTIRQKFTLELLKVQKHISPEILKCVFEIIEYQLPFRSKLAFKLIRCNISLVWEYRMVSLLTLQVPFPWKFGVNNQVLIS